MKKALTITSMTFLVTMRKGTLWALALVIIAFSSFAFRMAQSDGKLAHELEIRLTYSYGLTYSLLSLMIIALACFTIRSQIDAKNMHLVTAMPLERKWIFMGQALAMVLIALIAELILLGSVFVNSYLYSQNFTADERQQAFEKYQISRREVQPFYLPKRVVALNYAQRKEIDVKDLDGTEWYYLYHDALREQTLIAAGQSKSWQFDLGEVPRDGEFVHLRYNFQKGDKRAATKGFFELRAPGYNVYFKKEIVADQYAWNTVDIPIEYIPDNGRFEITFTNTGTNSVVVGRANLLFSYNKGSLLANISKCFLSQVFHLSVSSLVGLCAGVGLTFSVGTFMVIMLYLISSGQPVFQLVMQDYEFLAAPTFMDGLINNIMGTAIWLTKGLQAPGLVGDMSAGLNIGWDYLLLDWLPAVLVYGLLAAIVGSIILSRKELDKIQR